LRRPADARGDLVRNPGAVAYPGLGSAEFGQSADAAFQYSI
jgi:hypothetical protein